MEQPTDVFLKQTQQPSSIYTYINSFLSYVGICQVKSLIGNCFQQINDMDSNDPDNSDNSPSESTTSNNGSSGNPKLTRININTRKPTSNNYNYNNGPPQKLYKYSNNDSSKRAPAPAPYPARDQENRTFVQQPHQSKPHPVVNPPMGNQGIRQHVETSTKTGVFHLSKAKLSEFPPELAKIVNNLRSIDLSENKITAMPQNISAFVNLKHLNLSHNLLEIIPDQIGQLVKLETLSLTNNRLKAVPATVAHLQKLRDVNLSSNALTSFPVVFSSLKFLTVLDLAHNRIPEVPDGVGNLQVVELILNQNQVRSVSKDLAKCPNLKTLRLQENTLELTGLPTEILSDSQVSLLSLEGNLFDVKQLSDLPGYDTYMERYTSTKKKLT